MHMTSRGDGDANMSRGAQKLERNASQRFPEQRPPFLRRVDSGLNLAQDCRLVLGGGKEEEGKICI